MKRTLATAALTFALAGLAIAPTASADPGPGNPKVQQRTFTCDDGRTYDAVFVGPSASFLIDNSTSVLALKVFTEYFPDGTTKTFNYGIRGFDPASLVTCSYTDPQGVRNVFSGFFTPAS